jgi:hypothetical protein
MARKLAPIAALAVFIVSVHAGSGRIEETVTLTGEYVWNGEKSGLEAVFTGAGEGSWEVTFHVNWDGQPSVWKGTAKGGLSEGDLRGKAHPDGQQGPSFVFFGSFVNGTFQGTYDGPGDDERRETGALTLSVSQGECKGTDELRGVDRRPTRHLDVPATPTRSELTRHP